jgi:glycine betaine/proline transport system ATP-binding protein
VQENVQKLDGLIDPEDLEPVPPDTPVADLFQRCAESDLPVPVADEAGTLLGVIPRVTLLAALGAISTHVEEVVESAGEDEAEPALALTKEGSVDD